MIVACPKCDLRYDASGFDQNQTIRCRCGTQIPVAYADASARTLTCLNCGASADPETSVCTYCDAPLALRRCPACLTVAFSGARHCSECGASLGEPAREAKADEKATCPDCNVPMLMSRVGGKPAYLCARCSGLWLDHAVISSLVEKARHNPSLRSLLGWPPEKGFRRDEVRYKRCPECTELMRRVNFGKKSGVIVDICNSHGTWFDRGELAAVLRFVRDTASTGDAQEVETSTTIEPTDLDEALRYLETILTNPSDQL